MGFLMEKELKYLHEELAQPARPFLVIMGGAKVSDKIGVIKALMEKADTFLICGAMANTFFQAQGIPVGASRVEADKLDLARELLDLAGQKNVNFVLPVDALETDEIKPGANTHMTGRLSPQQGVRDGWQAVDIGPESIKLFQDEIAKAKTILWNGPLGIFEIRRLRRGHDRGRGSDGEVGRRDHHRRRRFCHRGETSRPGRQDDLHLHRRRRFARADRRQRTARCRRAIRQALNRLSTRLNSMRKKIIAANWKMHMTQSEAEAFITTFLREIGDFDAAEIVIVPPFTAISKVSELLTQTQNVKVGAQNMHWEQSGAFTGEISPAMLRELFVRYVVLGHSERRALFGETDEMVNRKVHAAYEEVLRPIVCVGETLAEREKGKVEQVLATQLRGSLANVEAKELQETVIAYEPVWAIGTGKTATSAQAQEAHAFIRKTLAEISDQATAERVRIQYGGSVKPDNARELISQPDIDGALVGGASLDPRSFAQIVQAVASEDV